MTQVALHMPTSEEHANLDLGDAAATSQTDTVGFDSASEATDGNVVYAADGSVQSWKQAVAAERQPLILSLRSASPGQPSVHEC